jgi:hypothetical protein
MNMRRLIAGQTAALLVCCSQLTWAQSASPESLSDFTSAASACIDAVSPDKLDSGKLAARGWVKSSDERVPFGQVAIYTHVGSTVRVYTSPAPSGYCIVDGYALDFRQFELYQNAIADRLKADYGTTGLTGVTIGKPGADDRRQGFVIGNAVAGYSAAMRPAGLNVRFTVINTKFSGSPEAFQTARPPLSEAEIAENRLKDGAYADYANGAGTAQDLVVMAKSCASALRDDGALPGDGWRKSIHASGTARSMEALKKRDTSALMAGMAHTRQVLYRVGHRGLVTKYFVRGVHNVCEATVYTDPTAIKAIEAQVVVELALGKGKEPSGKAKDFAGEYMVSDLNRTYQWDQSEIAFHQGHGTSMEGPDSGKSSINIFVF